MLVKEFRIEAIKTLREEIQRPFWLIYSVIGKNNDYVEVTKRRCVPPKKMAGVTGGEDWAEWQET